MRPGYLSIQTEEDLPGKVLIGASPSLPAVLTGSARPNPLSPSQLHFCARFEDLDAAVMHFHGAMPRRLVDCDRRLYRVSVVDAVAAADAIMLSHRRVYIAPALVDSAPLAQAIARRRARHLRWSRLFDGIGYLALLFLLVLMLLVR